MLDSRQSPRDRELARLLFIGSFADGIDTASLMQAIENGLADQRDRRSLRRVVRAVAVLKRSYAGLGDDARTRLNLGRYKRRADWAGGVIASAEA